MSSQGGTLHFCTYVGSGYFFGFKILNFNIFWGFQKNKYFLGYEDFVDIFLGYHHKIGLYLGVISMHFRGIFFGVPKVLNIFWDARNS